MKSESQAVSREALYTGRKLAHVEKQLRTATPSSATCRSDWRETIDGSTPLEPIGIETTANDDVRLSGRVACHPMWWLANRLVRTRIQALDMMRHRRLGRAPLSSLGGGHGGNVTIDHLPTGLRKSPCS
jgi:hypothetical protein